jgi:cell division transport system permease protein
MRLIFFTREAFRALRRNAAPSGAAIVTTVVTVVLLGVLIPIFKATESTSSNVRDQLELRVGVYDDATKSELQTLRSDLANLPHVDSVDFITKAEALQELKGFLQDDAPTEELHHNPLPANFVVRPDDPANLDQIRADIEPNGHPQAFSPIVASVFDRQEKREQIEQVTAAVKWILFGVTALLLIASLMLIGNTIRLSIYTRRREVEVMRLVGATRWFIRWPFMIEGVVVGCAGGAVAILILWLGKVTIVDPLADSFTFLQAQSQADIPFGVLLAVLFLAAVTVSTVGSGLTLRRFLKV